MEGGINTSLLESLIKEVESMNPGGRPTGSMAHHIDEDGFHEEGKLRFEYEDYLVGQLYAGLSALARDMYQHMAANPRTDALTFSQVIAEVNGEESSIYGAGAFPNYAGLPIADLPTGLAAAAESGKPTLTALADPSIVHEWTFKPGKRLLKKFGVKFHETVCGKGGPYDLVNHESLTKLSIVPTIAASILQAHFSSATFWYPLAVYVSFLLVKTGLKTYCEPVKSSGRSRQSKTRGKQARDTKKE